MGDRILNVLAENGLLVGFVIVFGLFFLILRNRATKLDSKTEFDAMITDGQPVMVEFYSNG